MIHKTVAFAMIFLLCFGLPATLSAKGRRGADVVITRLDGQRVTGELIAVTSDSVVVLCAAAIGASGPVASVDIKAVHSIKVVRKSSAATGAMAGLLAGAVAGGLWGHNEAGGDNEELSTIGGALFLGAVGGFIGLVVGAAAGNDDEITLAGQPEPAVRSSLAKLARLARERGAAPPESARAAEPETRGTDATAAARLEAAPRAPKTPRFKLTWSPMFNLESAWPTWRSTDGMFRFIGDYSDTTGPFPADIWRFSRGSRFMLGCVDFAYRWNRHFSSEIELYAPGSRDLHTLGTLQFTSDIDGLDYSSSYSLLGAIRSTSVLAGLNYRPFPSGFLRHQNQAFELGIAAGPAFVRIAEDPFPTGQSLTITRATLTMRARAAYDFCFGRAVSIGFFGE